MEKFPLHIKNPELQTSPEVEDAVKKEERIAKQKNKEFIKSDEVRPSGPLRREKVPNDPTERIEAYMDRLENIFLNPDEKKRERNLEIFRDKIYDALIIKRDNFPESYFELQQRIARERGQAVEVIPEETREQMKTVAIEDQKASLDAWMDYLTSSDAVYPAWFKYFVWKNVTKLSQFDKERGEFKKRTDTTVAPFPDIYREPLAQIADIYEKVKADNKVLKEPEIKEAFSKKFPTLYAELIQKSLAASMENREEVKGAWVQFEHGRNGEAEKLFQSLAGKGTGWCTAGQSTAAAQINSGDFYVYYTNDKDGNPTQPRVAIRMEENRIAEVRGILPHQGLEPVMQSVLDEKLKSFGTEADVYRKKSRDMKMLTTLERKRGQDESFTKEDLRFLYELNGIIEGFGYKKDPRVVELRKDRNTEADMLVVFECTKDEIAHVPSEISASTKAYVGQLEPGIFQKLPENLEHVYTSFPEYKIRREHVEIGGKSAEQLISEMESAGIEVTLYAKSMLLNKTEFIPGETIEDATLIRLTVADLGFKGSANEDQIVARAQELGLELCPPDTGPHYRLQYKNQPLGEYVSVAMKPMPVSGGYPDVFNVGHPGGGLCLLANDAEPSPTWDPNRKFVFYLRKSES